MSSESIDKGNEKEGTEKEASTAEKAEKEVETEEMKRLSESDGAAAVGDPTKRLRKKGEEVSVRESFYIHLVVCLCVILCA